MDKSTWEAVERWFLCFILVLHPLAGVLGNMEGMRSTHSRSFCLLLVLIFGFPVMMIEPRRQPRSGCVQARDSRLIFLAACSGWMVIGCALMKFEGYFGGWREICGFALYKRGVMFSSLDVILYLEGLSFPLSGERCVSRRAKAYHACDYF